MIIRTVFCFGRGKILLLLLRYFFSAATHTYSLAYAYAFARIRIRIRSHTHTLRIAAIVATVIYSDSGSAVGGICCFFFHLAVPVVFIMLLGLGGDSVVGVTGFLSR